MASAGVTLAATTTGSFEQGHFQPFANVTQSKALEEKNAVPVLARKPPSRDEMWKQLKRAGPTQPFDVLVIGGGATGTGCALDATTRWVICYMWV